MEAMTESERIEAMSRKFNISLIIAYDGNWHLRETTLVIHRNELGEVHYESRPIASGTTLTLAIDNAEAKMTDAAAGL